MAGTLQLTLTGKLTNGKLKHTLEAETLAITQTTGRLHAPVVTVGTSEEDLSVGDVGTLGWLYMKNLDSTNYVTWGPKSGGAMVGVGRLKAGETALLRLEPGITIRWAANTAAVDVQVVLFND